MGNKNARVIIPLAIGAWLAGTVAFAVGAPEWVQAAVVIALATVVPLVVLYLMADTGWSALAKRYRNMAPFTGRWASVRTGNIAPVSVHAPDYNKRTARFIGMLRVGTSDDSLHLSTMFSRAPVVSYFFPPLRIPWSEVLDARTFEAKGWTPSPGQTGALLRARYDPGYTGAFVELQVGEPPVFIQLPVALLGEHMAHLPLEMTP